MKLVDENRAKLVDESIILDLRYVIEARKMAEDNLKLNKAKLSMREILDYAIDLQIRDKETFRKKKNLRYCLR